MRDSQSEVTRVLLAWTEGDGTALGRLMPLVMDDLREIARRYMRRERPDHTLQATALVSEVYMRLAGRETVRWNNREHFLGFAANLMRRILVDHDRLFKAKKRGGGVKPLALDEQLDLPEEKDARLVVLDEGLRILKRIHPRQVKVVELVHFLGLTHEEAAKVLGCSPETVKRDWRAAKIWLVKYIEDREDEDEDDDGNE